MNKPLRILAAWTFLGMSLNLIPLNALAREDVRLDDGWLFKSGDVTNGWESSADTQDWQAVSLPHSWGWPAAQRGKKYYRGPARYRCSL